MERLQLHPRPDRRIQSQSTHQQRPVHGNAQPRTSPYLKPPMPTGQLLNTYYEHSDKIYEECEDKPSTACPSVAKESWCALSTAVPSSDVAEFRSYTSVASSWWAAHSSALADLKEECPDTWESAKMDVPSGEVWLDATEAFADCEGEGKAESGKDAKEEVKSEVSVPASASTSASVTDSASPKAKIDIGSKGLVVAVLMFWMGRKEWVLGQFRR
ncbi:hypothetical protein HBH61_179510 [Parastagonospora nodorum]|nr:hypothetical protein HBH61_179510 [Parastagonospora nodorum]